MDYYWIIIGLLLDYYWIIIGLLLLYNYWIIITLPEDKRDVVLCDHQGVGEEWDSVEQH